MVNTGRAVTTTTPATRRDRIFISYRRSDAAEMAVRLRQSLIQAFGEDRVFQDVDMTAGTDFPEALEAELDRAAVLLAVINDGWLQAADKYGRRRIDDETDSVRKEISYGLNNDVLVLPVLINDAVLPPAEGLPPELTGLTQRQFRRIDTNEWDANLTSLLNDLASHTGWNRRTRVHNPIQRRSMASQSSRSSC